MEMSEQRLLLSEDDIRTKVIYGWLAGHGFNPRDISIETTFEIRLGRGVFRVGTEKSETKTVRPRADILVRSNGKNLLIVEVKAPDESLGNEAKEQAISYARLLRTGGIAPFVVLTNGYETHIYDSISGNSIEGQTVPVDHPYAQNGFRVSGDDLKLQAEALAAFISLSSSNLIEFCRQQASYRMRLLKSDDLYSGKKYIPALYIERESAFKQLEKLIEEKQRMILVVGLPQVGKTNFLCHFVENRLERSLPCLFYPAIGMQNSLLYELAEDFEWIMGQDNSAAQIARKLSRVLEQSSQRLVIVIDGWNETDHTLARVIDHQCERLSCDNITFIVSLTNLSASRLLLDDLGNPSAIAEAAYIGSVGAIKALEIEPSSKNIREQQSIVCVDGYTTEEMDEAYKRYSQLYSVHVPTEHCRDKDPFLIRIGMEYFSGQVLPETFDEPSLIEHLVHAKIARGAGLSDDLSVISLSKLGTEMFLKDVPVNQATLMQSWQLSAVEELPKGFFEAALLAKVHTKQGVPAADFYYSRERNFVIAYWSRTWPQRLREVTSESMLAEIQLAANTSAGTECLRWFLKQRDNQDVLESLADFWPDYDSTLRRLVLSCVYEHPFSDDYPIDGSWIQELIYRGAQDEDPLVKVEAAKNAVRFTEDSTAIADILIIDKEFLTRLLEVNDTYPLEEPGVGHILLEAFDYLQPQVSRQGDKSLSISDIFVIIAQDNTLPLSIRSGAVKSLGYVAPDIYLAFLCQHINQGMDTSKNHCFKDGIDLAAEKLREKYHGDAYCRGWLHSLRNDSEGLRQEYFRMRRICHPVITFYWPFEGCRNLLSILESLKPDRIDEEELQETPIAIPSMTNILARRYQLPLPFVDLGETKNNGETN